MKYDHKKIEDKWQKKWIEEGAYEPNLKDSKAPFYNLMMFPYPSAEGLHVGNMYAFAGSDIYGRFMRMQNKDVFQPIGLDGFGIHSENYAMKVNTHPVDQAKISEKNFYNQLMMIGNGFAWNERLETYDPEYYRWTQWIFIQMFKNGLAYRKKSPVNWCPSCKTVLADEQVEGGACERCGTEVTKKDLAQWFFKITDYAERLLDDIDELDWSEKIKIAQRNWIGKSEGAMLNFPLRGKDLSVKVFTTRPDTLFGATYLVLGPEHEYIHSLKGEIENWDEVNDYVERSQKKDDMERLAEGREKTGVEIKGVKAINSATKEEIPVWVADYVLGNVGTGAIMAVPAHDERDNEFAKKFNIPIRQVIEPPRIVPDQVPAYGGPDAKIESECWTGPGTLINSDDFNGLDSEEAKENIATSFGGEMTTNFRLRDWLISRQRYWGPPIPMIYCPECAKNSKNEENAGWHPVSEEDLPVELPYIENFRPTGTEESPLATVEEFHKTTCPECGSEAKRETDVSDTFLDSAWYYYRYPSLGSDNSKARINDESLEIPWNQDIAKNWTPVDMYIGGAEHSVLHLLYTRFITKVFNDWGLVNFNEPFKKFRAHGLLIKEGAKMSKSKGNVINPDDYIRDYGADVLRTYLMFLAPFEQGGDFRDEGVIGVIRFLDRVYDLFSNIEVIESAQNDILEKNVHKAIKKVTEDIENLKYNTAISSLMVLLSEIEDSKSSVSKSWLETFLKLLAPFAPHLTEELWREFLHNKESIHISKWPEYDKNVIEDSDFDLVVQINGKLKDTIKAKKGITQEQAEKLVFENERIKNLLEQKKPKKVIYVQDRLINLVV